MCKPFVGSQLNPSTKISSTEVFELINSRHSTYIIHEAVSRRGLRHWLLTWHISTWRSVSKTVQDGKFTSVAKNRDSIKSIQLTIGRFLAWALSLRYSKDWLCSNFGSTNFPPKISIDCSLSTTAVIQRKQLFSICWTVSIPPSKRRGWLPSIVWIFPPRSIPLVTAFH